MPFAFTPIVRLSALIAASVVPVIVMLALATSSGRLGLQLEADPGWAELRITGVDPTGPSAGQAGLGLLIAVEGDGERVEVVSSDLIEEPDVLATYAEMNAFFARQSEIHSVINARKKIVEYYALDGDTVRYEPGLRLSRTVWELPLAFWLQIGVGLAGFWIGAWVWTLRRGDWVLCDRFADSTRVYQGEAGVDTAFLDRLEALAVAGCRPDLTVLIDVPADVGIARVAARSSAGAAPQPDRFETEGENVQDRRRRMFLELAASQPERFLVVDGMQTPDAVEQEIWRAVSARLLQAEEEAWR